LLDVREAKATQSDVVSIWIPAAMTAGLRDREARWRKDVLLGEKNFDDGQLNAFNLLEKQRMVNTERGNTLEKYAGIHPKNADLVLGLAEDAWRDEANHARELTVLRSMDLQNKPQANLRDRYFELLLRSEPDKLVGQASMSPANYADAAVNYALAKGTMPIAYASIDARSANLQPVWRKANNALVGMYFGDKSPAIDTAFRTVLDDRNVGQRVSTKTDTSSRLTGNSWFYYGMRYGVYRSFLQKGPEAGDAEDYLASGLEGAPNATSSYVSLAEAYADAGDTPAAIREYGHALELAPATAAIHRDIAILLWPIGRKNEAEREEAIGHWKQALEILRQLVDTRVVPESFWSDFAAIAGDFRSRGLTAQLRPQMDAVLKAYIAKNGDYRSAELLHSALIASTSPSDGVDWILSLAGAAHYPETLLSQLEEEAWMPRQQLGRVLRRELELAQPALPPSDDPSGYLNGRGRRIRLRLFQYLVDEQLDAEAQAFYQSIPEKERTTDEFQRVRIVLSAHQGQLTQLLADFS
jgi:cellulose synthase operon protein C